MITPLLQIKQEFKDLIPPLSDRERVGLEEDIKKSGCYCPIITWNDFIIDGHHRYDICVRHKLIFRIEEREFATQNDVEIWIIENQFHRRNLPSFTRATLTFELEKRYETRRGENQYTKESGSVRIRTEAKDTKEWATRKAAKAADMGHDTYCRCKFIDKHADEKTKEDLHKRKKTTNEVYVELKREKKREDLIKRVDSIEVKKAKAIEGVYDVVVIDPPWDMHRIELDERPTDVGFDYPTMSIDEIKDLEVPCADDCHVFLWATQKFLPEALEILKSWDMKYVCTFTWHKNAGMQTLGLPQYNAEHILYARKGKPQFVDTKNFQICFNAPRGKHSEKPKEFYETICRTTLGRRLDMFNRREINGFDGWGNEATAQNNIR